MRESETLPAPRPPGPTRRRGGAWPARQGAASGPPGAVLLAPPGRVADAVAEVAASVACPLDRLDPVDPGSGSRLAAAWRGASCVVVAAEAAESVARLVDAGRLQRRPGVLLADDAAAPDFAAALGVGAEHLVALPAGADWLAMRLADAACPLAELGRVVGVVGGRGGSGATTLAAVVATRAARSGRRAVVIDADPLGGGADLALGAETVEGLRWPALAGADGPLSADALAAALPAVDGVAVLAHDRGSEALAVSPAAMRSVVGSAARAYDLVVLDLPRALDPAAEEAALRADEVVVVVPAEVRATASATRVVERVAALCRSVGLVAMLPSPSGLDEEHVAEALGAELVAAVRREESVAEAVERGEVAALRKGSLVRAADRLVARWLDAA